MTRWVWHAKIAMDAQVKVDAKSDDAKTIIKRWFLDENCTDTEMNDALGKLSAGIKKISAACSSSTLVFTDYLDWRKQRNDYFGGAFRKNPNYQIQCKPGVMRSFSSAVMSGA